MGEYMALLVQVKKYVECGRISAGRDVLKKLLNELNAAFVSTQDPVRKDQLRFAITRLLPVWC